MAVPGAPARRRRLAARVVLALVGLVLLAMPAPAQAHASLVRTNPADGAVLATALDEVVLGFTEPVLVSGSGVRVFAPDSTTLPVDPQIRANDLVLDLPDTQVDGTYLVTWRVVSRDGHPISGSLTFSIGSVSAAPVPGPELAAAEPGGGVVQPALQAVSYLGFFLSAGLAIFAAFLLPRDASTAVRRRIRRVSRPAALLAGVAALLLVPVTLAHQQGVGLTALGMPWAGLTRDALLPLLLLLLALVVLSSSQAVQVVRTRRVRVFAGGGVLLGAVSFALSGHTRGTDMTALVVTTDVLHVLAGCIWLGGLVGLALTLPLLSREPVSGGRGQAARVLARFSATAAAFLAVLLASGTLLSWQLLGSWSNLVGTSYGRLLLGKIALVALAVGIAGWNRFVLVPRASRGRSPRPLVRAILAEATLLVVGLGITGVLVHQSTEPAAAASVQDRVGTSAPMVRTVQLGEEVEAVVSLSPGRPGANTVVVQLRYADGEPVHSHHPPTLALSTRGVDLGDVPLGTSGDGDFRSQVVLPEAGLWTARVGVQLGPFENPVAGTDFPVR